MIAGLKMAKIKGSNGRMDERQIAILKMTPF
jgi:hypothetical protein